MRRDGYKRGRSSDAGYALLLILFFLALLVVSLATAAPTVISTVQREREKEMVWRGKQYTRGIRLYYLKLHRFPTALDDLTMPKTGIRFMRQAYKDPMNQVDGSWRLIYVGPNGQLIGSLNNHPLGTMGMGVGAAAMAGAQGAGGGSLFGNSNSGSLLSGGASGSGLSAFGGQGLGTQGMGIGQTGAVTTALASGPAGSGTNAMANGTANSTDPNAANPDDPSQPHSLAGPMDASNTIGGNIIGVGSKINKKSFLIYEKAKNYRQFEFIWDPSKDTTVGRASQGIGSPIQGNQNGMSPAGANTNSPFSTGMTPPQGGSGSQNPNGNVGGAPTPDPNQSPPLQAPQ